MPSRTRNATATPEPEEGGETTNLADVALTVFEGNIASVGGLYTDENGQPLSMWGRIVRIMEDLPDIDPQGKNEHFKYKFITNTQINGLLRPRLARQKLMIFPLHVVELDPIPLTTQKGGHSQLTRLHVTFQIVDAINGETFTGEVVGYGDDSGDKGANKAFTAALKNFLIKLFLIGGDSDDLENDEDADKRAATRESGARQVTEAVIGEAKIEGKVKPGGRSEKATEAQIARVGQYTRDLQLTPEAFVAFVDKVLGDQFEVGEDPWGTIKGYLEHLSGADIGKLVARFDEILNQAEASTDGPRDEDPTNNYG